MGQRNTTPFRRRVSRVFGRTYVSGRSLLHPFFVQFIDLQLPHNQIKAFQGEIRRSPFSKEQYKIEATYAAGGEFVLHFSTAERECYRFAKKMRRQQAPIFVEEPWRQMQEEFLLGAFTPPPSLILSFVFRTRDPPPSADARPVGREAARRVHRSGHDERVHQEERLLFHARMVEDERSLVRGLQASTFLFFLHPLAGTSSSTEWCVQSRQFGVSSSKIASSRAKSNGKLFRSSINSRTN